LVIFDQKSNDELLSSGGTTDVKQVYTGKMEKSNISCITSV